MILPLIETEYDHEYSYIKKRLDDAGHRELDRTGPFCQYHIICVHMEFVFSFSILLRFECRLKFVFAQEDLLLI